MKRLRATLHGRVLLFGLTCLAIGVGVAGFGHDFIVEWFLSSFNNARICDAAGQCTTWPRSSRVVATVGVLAAVVVLVLLVRYASRRVVPPLAGMTDTVRQLGPQNLGQRIGYDGPVTELRALAGALDEMLDRVATGYEGQRRFASNASHELRTPLAVQRTMVEVAMVTGEHDLPRLAAQLLVVNERNERLIEGLLVLAESDRGLPGTEPVRLDVLVGEVLDRFASRAAAEHVTITRSLAERTVPGDPVLLDRLVNNLVDNAIKYNEPGGAVSVAVADAPALLVSNSGQRVPAETVPALFEPFRRLTSERVHQRDGAGLGLSIVRSIAAAHRGSVSARSGEVGGLEVAVNLP